MCPRAPRQPNPAWQATGSVVQRSACDRRPRRLQTALRSVVITGFGNRWSMDPSWPPRTTRMIVPPWQDSARWRGRGVSIDAWSRSVAGTPVDNLAENGTMCVEEALAGRLVPAVAVVAHRCSHAALGPLGPRRVAGVLAASADVEDLSLHGRAQEPGDGRPAGNKVGGHAWLDRPAHDLAWLMTLCALERAPAWVDCKT